MVAVLKNLSESFSSIKSRNLAEEKAVRSKHLLELSVSHDWPESGHIDWCLRENNHIAAEGRVHELNELPTEVRDVPVHLWTPAEDTLLTHVHMPTRSRSKIEQALPYALEDKLLDDPSDQFITYKRGKEGELNVSVTNRARLKQWIDRLEQSGLMVESITPISLSVRLLEKTWILFCSQDTCWLRIDHTTGFRCDIGSGEPPYVLVSALEAAVEKPDALVIHNPPGDFQQEQWREKLGLEILTEQNPFWDVSETTPLPLNLRQNEFAPKKKNRDVSRRFRPALIMFMIWFVGSLVFITYEWWNLDREYKHLRSEMTAIFKKSFPRESSLIVDPYKQMQANLAQAGSYGQGSTRDGFLVLLAGIAAALGPTETEYLEEISYSSSSLTILVGLPDYQKLEKLKNTLTSGGLKYSVSNVRQKDGKVFASIKLEAG